VFDKNSMTVAVLWRYSGSGELLAGCGWRRETDGHPTFSTFAQNCDALRSRGSFDIGAAASCRRC
jgi:hypothetical protein